MSTVWTYSQQTKAQFELHQLVESKKTREELEIIGTIDFDSKALASTLTKPNGPQASRSHSYKMA